MDAVDCFVESCGFKYKHIFNSQCYKVRSNIDFFFVYKWVILLDWIVITHITLSYYFVVWYLTTPLVIITEFGWCDPYHSWWGAQMHPGRWFASPSPLIFAKVMQWTPNNLMSVMGFELCEPFCLHTTQQYLMLSLKFMPTKRHRIPSLYIFNVNILKLTNYSVMFAHTSLMASKLLNKGELSYVGCVWCNLPGVTTFFMWF